MHQILGGSHKKFSFQGLSVLAIICFVPDSKCVLKVKKVKKLKILFKFEFNLWIEIVCKNIFLDEPYFKSTHFRSLVLFSIIV